LFSCFLVLFLILVQVHAVMYGYYMLKALRLPCPIPDFFITTMQISQMVVGTFIQARGVWASASMLHNMHAYLCAYLCIKLLGPPHAYPQPAPTGQAPVVYAARCLHVPPGSNS
jgi:hypothetical protein